ncbi:MAG TPA: MmcQ/YjbR family DNA-binding protein [Rhizomicrobium sp.]|jgi:hypothetical protein
MTAKKGVTPSQMKKIALGFPEAHEKPSYGKPAFFVAKKFFTRLRAEDNSIVFVVDSMDTRDMMLELDPKTYFITDHYKDYPAVLVRAERITQDELRAMLDRRWRAIAPKKLVKALDEKPKPAAKKAPAKKAPARKIMTKARARRRALLPRRA